MAVARSSVKFKTRVGLLRHLPGMHYLEVPASVVKSFGGKLPIRLHCEVKGVKFQCGVVALGGGRGYLSITRARMKAAGLKEGDRTEAKLSRDSSKYGMKVPKELAELLKQDAEAKRRFDGLTPGKQRYVIFYVSQLKDSERRLDRAFTLMENLKGLAVGKETFREMMGLPRKA